jgi:uncharacterized DUF497 family protein
VRHLTLSEVLELHRRVIGQSGGALGVLNLGGLESALAQPRMTFEGRELYPSIVDKAAALGYSLVQNHPFLDGSHRVNASRSVSPDDDEERWTTLGLDHTGTLLVICHTYREETEISARVRLISARKASKKETKQYQRK